MTTQPQHVGVDWNDDDDESPQLARGTLETIRLDETELVDHAQELVEIVHDLKNPLSTIALELCLLVEKLSAAEADVRGGLARIQHNVAYLDRLVLDILDSCALEADRFTLHRRPTELRAMLEQVIERVVPTRDRGRVYLEAPARFTVSIDELRIERVCANLVSNALKYAPRGTAIVVRLEVEGCVRISVVDGGPGLAPNETEHVFDKYWRAASSTLREGTGLGLYVARRIVEEHGGTIGVDSGCHAGSRFYFELPVS